MSGIPYDAYPSVPTVLWFLFGQLSNTTDRSRSNVCLMKINNPPYPEAVVPPGCSFLHTRPATSSCTEAFGTQLRRDNIARLGRGRHQRRNCKKKDHLSDKLDLIKDAFVTPHCPEFVRGPSGIRGHSPYPLRHLHWDHSGHVD